MEFLTYVFLFYIFLSFYYLSLFVLIYIQNRKVFFEFYVPKKEFSLSIVVPCYNEGEAIGENITALLKSTYPGLKKIIVVDDCSKDNSYEIIQQYAKKYPDKIIAVQTPKNTGNAAGAKNYGAQFVNTELIGFSDADSFPNLDAIYKMVGFFNDLSVGAVTSRVLVKNKNNLLARLQSIEYKVIAFTRKLLGFVDAIYVTNGPLSIYRKSAFDDVGGFDEKNLTEDIEITWHFVSKGWKVHMSIPATVYTVVPETIKTWFKQRLRWNIGGMQTIKKYIRSFLRCGMLGFFILPFFISSWLIAISGLFILIYRVFRIIFIRYLSTVYSVEAQTVILRLQDINLTPTILLLFGLVLISLSFIFTCIGLYHSREKDFKSTDIYEFVLYACFYLLAHPILLIFSMYRFVRGKFSW